MPQLDIVLMFNEAAHLIISFFGLYILLYRLVLTKLSYNLKYRLKLLNKQLISGLSKTFEKVWEYIKNRVLTLNLKVFYITFFIKKVDVKVTNFYNDLMNKKYV